MCPGWQLTAFTLPRRGMTCWATGRRRDCGLPAEVMPGHHRLGAGPNRVDPAAGSQVPLRRGWWTQICNCDGGHAGGRIGGGYAKCVIAALPYLQELVKPGNTVYVALGSTDWEAETVTSLMLVEDTLEDGRVIYANMLDCLYTFKPGRVDLGHWLDTI
jgi:hypothetical protein